MNNPQCNPKLMARNTQFREATDLLLRIHQGEPLPANITTEQVIAFATLLLAQTAPASPPAPLGY